MSLQYSVHGFTFLFTDWEPRYEATEQDPDGGSVICYGEAFKDAKLVAGPIPCIMTLREFNGPKSEELKIQIYKNATELLIFLAVGNNE